ncbi:MAG: Rrf2 family transcriptional regulator [candidate division Zixibacteria bacterium]|nr:Rrf2 family transcriptional regulator [candidate division Zixibacteria bacterium]
MKLSTRARYGLRMMVELSRELREVELVQLGKIARITGLSENYLAQLAIPLKSSGLLIGVSGKNGGYKLSRPAASITIREIVESVIGPMNLTDCIENPDICMNSSFCETRMIWAILSGLMTETLEKYSLEDLIDKERTDEIRKEYAHMPLLYPDRIMSGAADMEESGCPTKINSKIR